MSALHLEIPLVSLCLGWFPFTLLGKWSNLEQIFWDGWFNHQLEQVQPPIQKIWNESYCWCFQKFDCTRYDIVILKWRPDFSKSERFWNLQSWWCFFFLAIWKHQLVIYLSFLSIPKVGATYCHLTRPCDVGPLCYEFQSGHSQFFPPPNKNPSLS